MLALFVRIMRNKKNRLGKQGRLSAAVKAEDMQNHQFTAFRNEVKKANYPKTTKSL